MNHKKTLLGLENVLPFGKKYDQFQPTLFDQLIWCGDSLIGRNKKGIFRFCSEGNWEKELLFSNTKCRSLTRAKRGSPVTIENAYKGELAIFSSSAFVVLDIRTKGVVKEFLLNKKDRNFCYHFYSKQLAFASDQRVCLLNSQDAYRSKEDGSHWLVASLDRDSHYAPTEIYRSEFGVKQTMFWDQEGRELFVYEMSDAKIPEVILGEGMKRKKVRYPFVGGENPRVRLCIYDYKFSKISHIDGLVDDQYLLHPTFVRGQGLLLTRLNRDQKQATVSLYSSLPPFVCEYLDLYSETDETYVEPLAPPHLLKEDRQIVIESRTSGYNQLYLFNLVRKTKEQLTFGDSEVTQWVGYNDENREIYYLKAAPSPLQCSLYSKKIDGGEEVLLVQGGVLQAMISNDGTYISLVEKSHISNPSLSVLDNKTGKIHQLLTSDFTLKAFEMPNITVGKLETEDGVTLYWRMIKPSKFDPNKRYPAIIYLYGGPHVQLITDAPHWGAKGWDLFMAEQGYVIFSIDNRGSAHRGKEFEQITHKRLGEIEREDQLMGLNFLKSHAFVDPDRVGVFGWSFGGFMSLNMKFHYPDLFKVCVSGAPVTHWQGYEIMYGERYMETPNSNPGGYQRTDLLPLVGQSFGKTLIIHGGLDGVVLPMHSLRIVQEAKRLSISIDYLLYSRHGHQIEGRDQVKMYRKITNYFIKNL